VPQPDPIAFIRDGHGWIGEGAVERGDFAGADAYAAARSWWDALRAQAMHEGRETGPVAFGSFPFDPASPAGAVLLIPSRVVRVDGAAPRLGSAPLPEAEVAEGSMSPEAYMTGVARIAAAIGRGELDKAVLARDVVIRPAAAVDPGTLLDGLLAAHPAASVFAVDGLLGASPETLVTVHDGTVTARVLAGTIAPGEGARLAASAKDQREHELAARSVLEALAPHVEGLEAEGPFLLDLPHLTHLATDVTGRIVDGSDVLALVEALHPTAAVAGTPTAAAMRWIRELEPADRGRYAGPVGWMDAAGNGEWAIALRAAQARPDGSWLAFAGAGIMADSDPAAELAETDLKLRPILEAFDAG